MSQIRKVTCRLETVTATFQSGTNPGDSAFVCRAGTGVGPLTLSGRRGSQGEREPRTGHLPASGAPGAAQPASDSLVCRAKEVTMNQAATRAPLSRVASASLAPLGQGRRPHPPRASLDPRAGPTYLGAHKDARLPLWLAEGDRGSAQRLGCSVAARGGARAAPTAAPTADPTASQLARPAPGGSRTLRPRASELSGGAGWGRGETIESPPGPAQERPGHTRHAPRPRPHSWPEWSAWTPRGVRRVSDPMPRGNSVTLVWLVWRTRERSEAMFEEKDHAPPDERKLVPYSKLLPWPTQRF
ncbi:uncharacterized protein LOC120887283 [Ictidomys tridecemlineatus]